MYKLARFYLVKLLRGIHKILTHLIIRRFFDIDIDYIFEAINGGTRVTQHSIITPKGLFEIMLSFLGCL